MKRIVLSLTACVTLLLAGTSSAIAQRYNLIDVAPTGQTLYYYCYYNGSSSYAKLKTPDYDSYGQTWGDFEKPTGVLAIPDSVDYEGFRYPVKEIEERALYFCFDLKEVSVPSTVDHIGSQAFKGVALVHYNGAATMYSPWGARSINGYVENELVYADSTRTLLQAYIGDDTAVVVPSTVTSIGDYAFYHNKTVHSVQLPDGLDSIGNYAFSYCVSLTTLTIPSNVSVIGEGAFRYCNKLNPITVPTNVSSVGFYAFSSVRLIYYAGTLTPDWGAFCVNGYLDGDFCYTNSTKTKLAVYMGTATDVVIPSTVHTIGFYAFNSRSDITSVSIPSSVTTIEEGAFYCCARLAPLTIPNSVTSINVTNNPYVDYPSFYGVKLIYYHGTASGAPWGAYNMNALVEDGFVYADSTRTTITGFVGSQTTVIIPSSVNTIVTYSFALCDKIRELYLPNTLTQVESSSFYMCDSIQTIHLNSNLNMDLPLTSLLTLDIGNDVTQIHDSAFMGAKKLQNITFGANVSSIGTRAFQGCSSLTEITIPAQVSSIGCGAFANCTGLTTVNYYPPDCEYQYEGDLDTDNSLFANDTNVTTLNISTAVRRIPDLAFSSLGITDLNLNDSITYIGSLAFAECRHLHTVTIGQYTDTIKAYAFAYNTSLHTINFNADSCHYMGFLENNRIYSSFSALDTAIETINIGTHVKRIPDYAFMSMPNLVNVNLPSSLLYIGDYAFAHSGIPGHVVIPDSVRYIGYCAFWDCKSIAELTIGRQVDTIDKNSFHTCRNLSKVYFNADSCRYMGGIVTSGFWAPFANDTNLAELYIGSNVKSIPDFLFINNSGKGLRHIYFGDSLKYIGVRAFYNTQLSDTIVLPESVKQIGEYAFCNCDSMTAIVIGENVESIGAQSFQYCDNLRSITLHSETPASLGSSAFSSTPSDKVFYIPCGTTSAYNSAWGYFNYSEPVVDFEVTVLSSNTDRGTATMVTPRISCVDSSIVVRANANYHYHFVSWSNGRTANPDTLFLNSDTSVTALFAPDRYQVNVVSNDTVHGSVTGSGEYDYLDTILLTATAAEHYHFVRWNGWYTENPYQYVVTGNTTITGYFEIDRHQVVAISNDEMKGVVTGGGSYNYGSPCTLTASAYTGYQFIGWSNGQTANPYSFPVLEDMGLTAMFVEEGATIYTVTATSADLAMGTATVNGGSTATVEAGETVTLVATANEGYHFTRWNDNSTDATRTVTVTGDILYIAYFESDAVETYTVSVSSDDPSMGTATVNGSSTATVELGEIVTLVATANEGYQFVRWNDDNTDATRTVIVTSDMSFTAYFESLEGIEDVDGNGIRVYAVNGQIVVDGIGEERILIYDIVGRNVRNESLPRGVYMVKVGDNPARKVVVIK